ncbi:radical SAM protein [Roseiflexus castenholzii]|uniref:Radical SAM domain protein n=1 Tax=Roseiflexus castenholzii (strain DSM 13941 / HLO8) TaxID=383372 RepID=A7NS61_ROSCS|nr:radical SAM protein [Roseiflexus castenholzii]ABU60407.1 Radical SAM domain protein [Roseiflexus castenholzii DSM 13941]
MDLDEKLAILAPAARFDACDRFLGKRRAPPPATGWNDDAVVADADSDGRALPVFRLLLSNRCEWNCAYCPLRSGNDMPRAALNPNELARVVLPRVERKTVQGLLISTGVDGSPSVATERLLDAVEALRARHGYTGYVHLKLPPGAPAADIERAARLADRISLNLEAPTAMHLARISPERDWLRDLIAPLALARDWSRTGAIRAGLATQFVVGAAGESDHDLLVTTTWLYRDLGLRRVYFGAFRPVAGTPLEQRAPTPFVREQRLREADWLVRRYGFDQRELPYDAAGNLPLHIDPKLAWALAHPERFPVELNSADRDELLRVPGLGPVSVARILRLRREGRFREPAHLAALGGALARARDFVTLDGRFFGRNERDRLRHYARQSEIAEQLTLW